MARSASSRSAPLTARPGIPSTTSSTPQRSDGYNPDMTHAQRRWLLQFAAAFAVWTLLAYFYAFQRVQLAWLMDARRMPLWEALWPAFMTFWVCALLTPAVLEFARC